MAEGGNRKSPALPEQFGGGWQPPHSLSTHGPVVTPMGEASSSTFSPETAFPGYITCNRMGVGQEKNPRGRNGPLRGIRRVG